MAKTVAERRAEYRARRALAGENQNGERRISTWVNTSTTMALRRLAKRHGVTQREIIERLIRGEDEAIRKTMTMDSPEYREYHDTGDLSYETEAKQSWYVDDAYKAMAADKARETEAQDWCNALAKDIADQG